MAKSKRAPICPCTSGRRYAECCRPHHRGETAPARPGELVRARFAAFALGDGAFLYRTLDPAHPLRARPEAEVMAELSRAKQTMRYRSLEVREDRVEAETGQALFAARVFERGRDRSFVELSRFTYADGWRYRDGLLAPLASEAGAAPGIDAFLVAVS